MKSIGAYILSLLVGLAALQPVSIPEGPKLVAPPSLKTNKAGRVRFEVQTNCKAIAYLVDDESSDFDRVYTDPSQFVYKFSADKPGVYKIIFVAASGDIPIIAQTVITYDGDIPNPVPPGPSPPGPAPNPPHTVARLFIVVIEETGASKASRGAYYGDAKLVARAKEKGWGWRVEDKDVKNALGQTPPDLAPYIKAASGKEPYLFLVNEKGKVLHEGPLPPSPADLLALIQKVGG